MQSTSDTILANDKNHNEHILVCLSASPSNANIIRTAAKMAEAFQGTFTALYVKTNVSQKDAPDDSGRLQDHIKLAESLGAVIATAYGEDVSYQIAEFARISGVTKIVIGRSNVKKHHFWSKPALNERLIKIAPDLEIHIIPDTTTNSQYSGQKEYFLKHIKLSLKDLLITLLVLCISTGIGTLFWQFHFTEANIITVYILAVLLTSLFTKSHLCSVISSLGGVLLFNFFFTEPRLTFHAYEQGYPFTFAIMLTAALITGTLANKLKDHAKQSAQAAFRTRVLFDTNQLLHKAKDENEIINITANQLLKLLDRSIIIYPEKNGQLANGYLFNSPKQTITNFSVLNERYIAEWVYKNNKRAGADTNHHKDAQYMYLAIRINQTVYGVVGIMVKHKPLESFESSVLLSILGECALAIENTRNALEKEASVLLAQKEQLRANLLRAISHDLRTPLTTISGNASNLLYNAQNLDDATKEQMYQDIFDDSEWLISLVENLLSITRLEEGRLNFNMTTELIDEVIEESLQHFRRKNLDHHIITENNNDILLAKMDAKLILQVITNLVDNAVKYTPKGSTIHISSKKIGDKVFVSILDNGPGIPDSDKEKVFERFYTGNHKIIDSRRSLGLGLALCRSIIHAHNGELYLTDNEPHGCIFTFTLPSEEVVTIE